MSSQIPNDKEIADFNVAIAALQNEELNFQLSHMTKNEKDRTLQDVRRDEIALVEKLNSHLEEAYSDNEVVGGWLGTNKFLLALLKEKIV